MNTSKIKYKVNKQVELFELLNLYKDAGWLAYTNQPKLLQQAINQSLYVIAAYDNQELVGLLRVVGDGLTIVYIQDILVLKSHQRFKIGTQMMLMALDEFKSVRQKVLLTDDQPKVRKFYESLGFVSCDKGQLVAFAKLENASS